MADLVGWVEKPTPQDWVIYLLEVPDVVLMPAMVARR
jgi:hypothetical protein